jgi:hypothetical protein
MTVPKAAMLTWPYEAFAASCGAKSQNKNKNINGNAMGCQILKLMLEETAGSFFPRPPS